jgi:hypothetical protein
MVIVAAYGGIDDDNHNRDVGLNSNMSFFCIVQILMT